MLFTCKSVLRQAPYSNSDVNILDEQPLYQGFFKAYKIRLEHKLFAKQSGQSAKADVQDKAYSTAIERELVHRAIAVAAMLYDPHLDAIGLIEQFRVGALDASLGPWTLEGVAGMRDHAEEPLEAVMRRELIEEAGIEDCTLIPIVRYLPSPGGWAEQIQLYCALCDLRDKQGRYGLTHESEDLYLHVFRADDVFDALYTSRANNAATLIGLQWLKEQRSALRESAQQT